MRRLPALVKSQRLRPLPLRVAAPALAGWIGWPGYFAATLPLYAAAVAWLAVAVDRTLRDDGAAR